MFASDELSIKTDEKHAKLGKIRGNKERMSHMNLFANIIWFVLGGFISWASWIVTGILWSITIVGIPVGVQCFKFAKMAAAPFGKEIQFSSSGASLLINILWMIFGGLVMAAEEALLGVVFCLTIVGIPFGLQHFKHAKLALLPFGSKIYRI